MTDAPDPNVPRVSSASLPDASRATLPGAHDDRSPIPRTAPPPAPTSTALALGFALGRARILRRPSATATILGGALVLVAALIERRAGSAGAVDRTLAATFNLVLPLVTFALAAEVAGRGNLREGLWSVARHGVARRGVALGVVAAGLIAAATLGAGFALLAVAGAHAEGNPPLGHDAFTSAWIGALTASAYLAWFSVGATFGRRGAGRWIPLVADFALGSTSGILGVVLPRAHAVSLLGGIAPLGLPQASSTVTLVASALILAAFAALRCGR
jgi:hypothetical protein